MRAVRHLLPVTLSLVVFVACGPTPDRDGGNDTNETPDGGQTSEQHDAGSDSPDAGESGVENTDALCSDGVSNDGDEFVDCLDYDCSRNPAVTVCSSEGAENTDALCSDGVSNDGDEFVDCLDYDCSRNPQVTVCAEEGDCEACVDAAIDGVCSDEFVACGSKVTCQSYMACSDECVDQACLDACASEEPEGASLYATLFACIDGECDPVCD